MNCQLEMNVQSTPFQMKLPPGSDKKSNGPHLCAGHGLNFMMPNSTLCFTSCFRTQQGQDIRVLRNDNQEWGFYLQSRTWIPFANGIHVYQYEAAYPIHQPNRRVRGYTDFLLPKDIHESFVFLDFVYQVWGIENIRIREQDTHIDLSIKSGEIELSYTDSRNTYRRDSQVIPRIRRYCDRRR